MFKRFGIAVLLLLAYEGHAQLLPASGRDLIRQMYEKNHQKFYTTLTFSQKIFNYQNDSVTSTDVWHEAYSSPSNLILKFSSWESGNGVVFAKDSLYTYEKGILKSKRQRVHDLLVLGFDVNNVAPDVMIPRIAGIGYNLNKIERSMCLGRNAWLVGNPETKCFWVDMETLLFLKMSDKTGDNPRSVEFAKYENVEGCPVATEIRFYKNSGRLYMVESYFNVRPNVAVNAEIFNPFRFAEARW